MSFPTRLTMLALGGDRCLVSIRRAISERVTSGPEGTIRANTVLAMMRPPAIQAKVNMEPPRIGGNGRQKISRPTFVGEPESTIGLIASTLIRRLLGRVGFAIESLAPTTCGGESVPGYDRFTASTDRGRLVQSRPGVSVSQMPL